MSESKQCPFCMEQIRAEAVKCRYCGEWLEEPLNRSQYTDAHSPKDPASSRRDTPAEMPHSEKSTADSAALGITSSKCDASATVRTVPAKADRPALVTATAATWIVLGSAITLMAIATVIVAALDLFHPAFTGPNRPQSIVGGLFWAAIGVALLYVGSITLRGKAKDTLGNSLGSLGLGAFPLMAGSLSIQNSVIGGLILVVPGLCLFSAGVFGLLGRPAYKVWRARLSEPQ